ncbi:uncharacterized protein LOC136043406 [Artemia franciscana]|uniref:uncharacterized protein LOC136043406 n=1 Tax=Artemia franciscana TaxID=6661 RepID=UPI0032DB649D
MIAHLQIKLRAQKKTQQDLKKLYDTDKLQDQKIRRDFCISVWNKFDALPVEANDSESVEEKWEKIKSAYTTIAAEKLGFRKKPKERWISDITWKLIDERKTLKQAMLIDTTRCSELATKQIYKEKDKEVKKSARKDKRQFLEKKAALAEEADRKGDSKTLYRLTNEMVGKQSSRITLVKDENGSIISDPEKIDERWASHFEKLLNRPRTCDQANVPDIPFMYLDFNTDPPSAEEIMHAAKKLKNGRAPGIDGISAEMLKYSISTCISIWLSLFTKIWTLVKVPRDWSRGITVKLFKEGDLMNCHN